MTNKNRNKPMRRLLLLLLLGFSLSVLAQTKPLPKDLQPLPEPPPPPPGLEPDQSLEPEVTIIKRAEATVEEFRINGKLYMVKVTPRVGLPYYLIDYKGDGHFSRQDHFDQGVRPPLWVIYEF